MSVLTKNMSSNLLGAIEAGGTKFNCIVATRYGKTLVEKQFPTRLPEYTLADVRDFFAEAAVTHGPLSALGIASFGPLDLNKKSATYGYITNTPKAGWSQCAIVDYFEKAFSVPIAFETDVNGAALGELYNGAAKGCENFVYVTIGTGIGAGVVINGKLLQGVSHPEVGHMLVPRAASDSFEGCCPFHADCVEGLASGTAISTRWKQSAKELADDHSAWALEAHYLALLCVNLTHAYSPEKIVLGGGVMEKQLLFPLIRTEFSRLINRYAPESIITNVDNFIVPTGLEGKAGMIGALHMAAAVSPK